MNGLIHAFAGHRIAPNLLMLLMIVSGVLVIDRFETRFFPEFSAPVVRVSVLWQGASAEDVDASLLTPLENELRNVPDLKEMTSSASDGLGIVFLEFPDGVDLDKASEDTRRYLDLVAGKLPSDSEAPEAQAVEFMDEVMRLSMTGNNVRELRRLARQIESELLRLGKVRVEVSGLPQDRIEIRFTQRRLSELDLTLDEIGKQIMAQNIDVTAGDVDSSGASRLLRALSKRESISAIEMLTIVDGAGNLIRLGDAADIVRSEIPDGTAIYFNGKPAVQFDLTRQSGASALEAGEGINRWLEEVQLPAGVELTAHKQEWQLIQSRLDLLLNNGFQGMILVVLLLFIFLRWQLAFWVAAGIPATFMVAISVLFFAGGSIDMLTMFAFIMTTGIVVDDAIVVGENAMYHAQKNKPPLQAAVTGAREMFPAVFSSTFTTIASFMPLMIIGGPIGSIIFVIPLVVICVLSAALFECFTVLPGHIAGAFKTMTKQRAPSRLREAFDTGFNNFQEGIFRRLILTALRYRWVVIVSGFVMLVLSISLFIGGAVKYRFFPGAELNRIIVQADFVAGTPRATVETYMQGLYDTLVQIAAEYPEQEILQYTSLYIGRGFNVENVSGGGSEGDEIASMYVEMTDSEQRQLSAAQLSELWQARARPIAGLESLSIREESGGPPGEDLNVRLFGVDNELLKAAALDLRTALQDIVGVSGLKDDMPYGKKQVVFELTSLGRSLNLSVNDIARQLRDAFDGFEVQTFYQGVDEIELRVVLHGNSSSEDFASFRVHLPGGDSAALLDLVTISSRRGFDTIQRVNAQPVVHVVGEVDFTVTDANTVLQKVEADILPALIDKYGVQYSFAGSRADEEQTVADMKTGLQVAGLMIFIILAAVFASWTLPLAIILTAPLGVIGAILGHWIMGYEMSILSMFGIFTLNGIVINDSIVLVRDYIARREAEPEATDDNRLIADAVCRRLRAIVLTSLTTIGGLTPLMFETSTQAQFLIPMAISVCFGLAFATFLILFVMPAYLSVHHSVVSFFGRTAKAVE